MNRLALIGLSAVVVSGCGAGSHKRIELMPPLPASCSSHAWLEDPLPGTPYLRATTFNLGLAPGVQRLNRERRPHIIEALRQELQRSDLVCVQEAWLTEDRQAILKAVNLPTAQVHHIDSRGYGETGRDRCRPSQTAAIMDCLKERCRDVPVEETAICARQKCLWKLVWLYLSGRNCLNCLTSMVGHGVSETLRVCVDGPGRSRAYRGSNGLLLLSRYPLKHRSVVNLPASGSNRVALLATATVAPGKELEVGCVHLTSRLKQSPTSGYPNWRAEQAAQLRRTSQVLARRARGRPQLLLGDFNFGQRHGPVSEVMWPTWRLAVSLGFVSPAGHARPPLCSYCRGNRLSWTKARTLIDHVLLRQGRVGFKLEPVCAAVRFDRPVWVQDLGKRRSVHLSDHYGVTVRFRLRPPGWQPSPWPLPHAP